MSLNELTDEELMKRVIRLDASAFQVILNKYSEKVYAFAWRLAGNKSDAEDLTQEVFLKVWRNAGAWQPNAKLSTWLYKVLYNLHIDTIRRNKPTENTVSEEIPSSEESPEDSLLKRSESDEIAQAVNTLPERQKEALILCYHQGLKAKEAAGMLSISLGALESLLFRARQTLKEKLLKKKED